LEELHDRKWRQNLPQNASTELPDYSGHMPEVYILSNNWMTVNNELERMWKEMLML
jgi:hypothetical protein